MPQSTLQELLDAYGPVEELAFDAEFFDHMADPSRSYPSHQVTRSEVSQVKRGAPEFMVNLGANRRAPIAMLGPTDTGRIIKVPLEPTDRWGVWRPITAFEASTEERTRYGELTGERQR